MALQPRLGYQYLISNSAQKCEIDIVDEEHIYGKCVIYNYGICIKDESLNIKLEKIMDYYTKIKISIVCKNKKITKHVEKK